MKRFTLIILTLLLLTGCAKNTATEPIPEQPPKPVKVMIIQDKAVTANLYYDGLVSARDLQKLSFKTPGTIKSIPVNEGDLVDDDTLLAELSTEDLTFAVTAAKQSLNIARSRYQKAVNGTSSEKIQQTEMDVKKAEEAYNLAEATYNSLVAMKEQGGEVADLDLSKAKTDKEIKKYTLQQAQEVRNEAVKGARSEDISALKSQVDLANTDYEHKKLQLEQCKLKSSMKGYVAKILMQENEVVSAGLPVVILRSEGVTINMGLSGDEVGLITIGKDVAITKGSDLIQGTIDKISELPDPNTLTYNVEITPTKDDFKIGSIAQITIPIHTEKGIWIPIQHIKSSYDDYVYIIEGNIVVKRHVIIKNMSGSYARVEGLLHGDQLVIEGHRKLQVNDTVTIVE